MIEIRVDCVGCETCTPGCAMKSYKAKVCDICEREVERLYWYDGDQVCEDCILSDLQEVDPDEM